MLGYVKQRGIYVWIIQKESERQKAKAEGFSCPDSLLSVNWETTLGESSKYTGGKPYTIRIEIRDLHASSALIEQNFEKVIKTPIPKGGLILRNSKVTENDLLFMLIGMRYDFKPNFNSRGYL